MKHLLLVIFCLPIFVFSQCDKSKREEIIKQLEKEFNKRPGINTGSFHLKKDGTIRILTGAKSLLSNPWIYEYEMPLNLCEFNVYEKNGKPRSLQIYNDSLKAKYIFKRPDSSDGVTNGFADISDAQGKQYIDNLNIEKKIEYELNNVLLVKQLLEELQCIDKE